MQANLKKNFLHTCKVKQNVTYVRRQEAAAILAGMVQHNTHLTTIETLTHKSAEQHAHIIACWQMLLSILETEETYKYYTTLST